MIEFRRIKRITSHVGHGRYLMDELIGDNDGAIPIGEIPRIPQIPSPYVFSPRHLVFAHRKGGMVIIVETAHKQYDVFKVYGPDLQKEFRKIME